MTHFFLSLCVVKFVVRLFALALVCGMVWAPCGRVDVVSFRFSRVDQR